MPRTILFGIGLLFTFLYVAGPCRAQDNLLKRRFTVSLNNLRLEEVLRNFSERGGFSFSYNSALLPVDSVISVQAGNETLGELLRRLLPPDIDLKVSGNHLVLLKKVKDRSPEERKEKFVIRGQVMDGASRRPLADVLVYDVTGLLSALTNDKGEFTLTVPQPYSQLSLSVSKAAFASSILLLKPQSQYVQVALEPMPAVGPLPARSVTMSSVSAGTSLIESLPLVKQLVPPELITRTENLSGYLSRPAQLSLLPGLGTNLKMGGLVRNAISVNLLGGYAYGLRGLELGGLFNINRREVYGVQVAGLTNFTGGNTSGVQVGGISNHARGTSRGWQVAGLHNVTGKDFSGLQLAGLNNVVRGNLRGWQLAGLRNHVQYTTQGIQIAGLVNRTAGTVQSLQLAGGLNLGDRVEGVQTSVLVNWSGGRMSGLQLSSGFNRAAVVTGLQLAGGLNLARDTVAGVQAGLVNVGRLVRGLQIGLINYADSASGVPIGLISIVRKGGYFTPEFSANELTYANAGLKIGVKRFYTLITAGVGTRAGELHWMYGYGIGTERGWGARRFWTLELTNHTLRERSLPAGRLNMLNRLQIVTGFRRRGGMAISLGPSLNLLLAERRPEDSPATLAPYTLLDSRSGHTRLQGWVGGKIGIHW